MRCAITAGINADSTNAGRISVEWHRVRRPDGGAAVVQQQAGRLAR